jgi:hypothetical protein
MYVYMCKIVYATCLHILAEFRSNNSNNIKKYKMFSIGNNVIYMINCIHRKSATLHTLETFLFQVYNCKYLAQM